MSQLSQPSDAGDLQHLELVVTKETPTTRIGIKLRNSRRRRLGSQIEVEIVEVLANGPLAGIVKEGDTLVAVDGIPCLSGHEMVLESFAEKVGDIKLTIKPLHPKSPTFPRRLVSISTDAGGELDSGAPLSTPRSSGSSPLRSLQRPTSSLQPSGSGPRAADLPLVPRAATEAMLKGVYSEILVRDSTHSLGVGWSQLRWDWLPTIEHIDPAGPAAGTSICVGDILLEVNGVSASTDPKTLKRALGNETSAVFTLLRKEAHAAIDMARLGYRLRAEGFVPGGLLPHSCALRANGRKLIGREEPDANESQPNQGQGQGHGHTQRHAIKETLPHRIEGTGHNEPHRIEGTGHNEPHRIEGTGHNEPRRIEGTGHNEPRRIEALAKSEVSSEALANCEVLSSAILPTPSMEYPNLSMEQAADMLQAGNVGFRKVYTRVWARAWAQQSLSGDSPTSIVEGLVAQLTLLRKGTARGPNQQYIDGLVNSLNSSLHSSRNSGRNSSLATSLHSSLECLGLEHTAAARTKIVAAAAAPRQRRRSASSSPAASKTPPPQELYSCPAEGQPSQQQSQPSRRRRPGSGTSFTLAWS